MMKFLKLRLKNFMPFYGNNHEVLFPTDSYQNILLIHGHNTYGKTSILRSLRWGLYGRVFDKFTREISYLSLLNRTAAKENDYEFEIIINFEANNHRYEITRNVSLKQNITVPQSNSDFILKTFFKKDGDVLLPEDADHEISLIAPEPVSRFFLFDGELLQEYEHLLEEGTEVGKKIKESIEQILGVPSLSNGEDDTLALLKKYRSAQRKELKNKGDVGDLTDNIETIEGKILHHEGEIEEFEGQKIKTQQDIDDIEAEINDIEAKSQVADKIATTKDEIKDLEDDIEKLKVDKLNAASKAWAILLKPKLLKIQKESRNDIENIVNQYEKVGALKKELSLLNNLLSKDTNCGICNINSPNLDKEALENKKNKIQEEINLINTDNTNFSQISSRHDSIRSLLNLSEDSSLKDIDDKLDDKFVELTAKESHLEELRSELGSEDSAKHIKDQYIKLGGLTKLLETLDDSIRKEKESIVSCNNQIKILEKEIEEAQGLETSPTTKYVALFTDLNEIFSESINYLRDNLKEEVEKKASEAFAQLIHRRNYSGLKINNNYGLEILNNKGEIVVMKSSGAEQIVALSLIDALSRTGRTSGPVVMDTPFGRLDPQHREKIIEYLPNSASQLMLFVHKGETDEKMLKKIASQIGGQYQLELQDDEENSLIRKKS